MDNRDTARHDRLTARIRREAAAARPIFRCHCHDRPYTRCRTCDHQYCREYWMGCPRCGFARRVTTPPASA